MMANPPQIIPVNVSAPQAAAAPESAAQLPVGEILVATAQAPPPGSPPGSMMLALKNLPPALIRAAFPLNPGERLALEVEGKGKGQTIRLLARSGGGGAELKALGEGQIRLAQNQPLTAGLRAILAGAKGTILGEVLPFRHPGSAPVKIGSLKVNFQLDRGASSGDRLFIRAQEAGGSLGLRVFARGGAQSSPAPRGPAGLAQVLRVGPSPVSLSPQAGLPAPGSILTGTLLSVSPAPAGSARGVPGGGVLGGSASQAGATFQAGSAPGAGAAFQQPSLAGSAPSGQAGGGGQVGGIPQAGQTPQAGGGVSGGSTSSQAGQASAGSAAGSLGGRGARTAVLRFQGFDAEVPWPAEAAGDFQPGATVRVLVNQTQPVLDLTLLTPAHAGESEGFIPSGGAGASGFGTNLITLAEGLGAAQGEVPQGEVRAAYDALLKALDQVVLKEGGLSAGRLREAIRQSGALPGSLAGDADGMGPDLRESLQQFVRAVRVAGLPEGNLLSQLMGQAEQTLTAVEFLQTVNGLRHLLDQGTYLQLPFALGGERGTMDVIIRRDGKGSGGGGDGEGEQHSAVFLLELEGLGRVRVDAGLQGKRFHARFTTPNEEVGRFIESEMPKLREAIETHDFIVEGISWLHDRAEPEPVIPSFGGEDPTGETSFINLRI